MSHEPGREHHMVYRPVCEVCEDVMPDGSQEDDYGRLICLNCQQNEAEAAYERQCEDFHDGGTPTPFERVMAEVEAARKLK